MSALYLPFCLSLPLFFFFVFSPFLFLSLICPCPSISSFSTSSLFSCLYFYHLSSSVNLCICFIFPSSLLCPSDCEYLSLSLLVSILSPVTVCFSPPPPPPSPFFIPQHRAVGGEAGKRKGREGPRGRDSIGINIIAPSETFQLLTFRWRGLEHAGNGIGLLDLNQTKEISSIQSASKGFG